MKFGRRVMAAKSKARLNQVTEMTEHRRATCGAGRALLAGILLAASTTLLAAESDSAANAWKFKANLYVWGAAIEGETRGGSEIDVPFSEIWDNLNFALMGGLEARKGKWAVLGDFVYLDAEGDESGTLEPFDRLPISIPVDADVEVEGLVLNIVGARNLYDEDNASIEAVFGVRYLDLDSTLTAKLGSRDPVKFETDDTYLDGVIGLRGQVGLSDKWYVPYYFDVGTGDSDFTWQGYAGVGYAFEHVNVVVAYRYLYWDFGSDEAVKDLNFGGPLTGVQFVF